MRPARQLDTRGRLQPGSRLGRYEILTRLASGGMAEVYVARALGVAGFERLVAVKVLHANLAHEQEFITMFLDEARLAARIRHPNVVSTLDISGDEHAGYFLVMEYIEGDHLGALVQDAQRFGARLPVPAVLRIIIDALSGLSAAHQLTDEQGRPLNLVHRDVSPHNIMVGADGVARLTDFGVAKAEDRLTHTREGQVKGKLAYMAPEHASQGRADQRADLFSMGVVLWECLTGRRLFRAENAALTLNRILNEPAPLLSSVDTALAPLDGVLQKALARDAEARFQSSDELIDALEARAAEVGGIGSQRAVKRVVRRHAGDKLQRDGTHIRQAARARGVSTAELPPPQLWQAEPSWQSSISAPGGGEVRQSQSSPSTSGVYSPGGGSETVRSRPLRSTPVPDALLDGDDGADDPTAAWTEGGAPAETTLALSDAELDASMAAADAALALSDAELDASMAEVDALRERQWSRWPRWAPAGLIALLAVGAGTIWWLVASDDTGSAAAAPRTIVVGGEPPASHATEGTPGASEEAQPSAGAAPDEEALAPPGIAGETEGRPTRAVGSGKRADEAAPVERTRSGSLQRQGHEAPRKVRRGRSSSGRTPRQTPRPSPSVDLFDNPYR